MSDLLAKARLLPRKPGCYIMKNAESVEIYVGKAVDLRRRVSSYFLARDRQVKEQAMIENVADFEFVVTESEVEALLLESRLIKDLQPRYNVLLKNNEMYPFLMVTMEEEFPRVLVTRKQHQDKNRYFGPFPSSSEVSVALNLLGRAFKFRSCSKSIHSGDQKRRRVRPCLNYHIHRCTAPCADRVSKTAYRRQIAGLLLFLSGKKRQLIASLEEEMKSAAHAFQFELAAELRDCCQALERLNSSPILSEELVSSVPVIHPQEGLESLRRALKLSSPPRRIDGIDIAHLQGTEMVGSVVTFLDGLPFKDGYRRFRIKTVGQIDDYASIAEVVRRRYSALVKDSQPLPDLILVDGGKGQLGFALQALTEAGVSVDAEKEGGLRALMSLAKQEETPFLAGLDHPVPLTRRSAGLKLLMYVRDEAHRFAQHYHHLLRRKAMFE